MCLYIGNADGIELLIKHNIQYTRICTHRWRWWWATAKTSPARARYRFKVMVVLFWRDRTRIAAWCAPLCGSARCFVWALYVMYKTCFGVCLDNVIVLARRDFDVITWCISKAQTLHMRVYLWVYTYKYTNVWRIGRTLVMIIIVIVARHNKCLTDNN